jgi:hypothetical protein
VSRRVRLVVCSSAGEALGALPTFTIGDPWWPEVQPVIQAARERFGIELVVLRLLHVESSSDNGGNVTYLAEIIGERPRDLVLAHAAEVIDDAQPFRAVWAYPGGIAATIAWADAALRAIGRPRTAPAVQVKTWNLSSILRLPTARGAVWCKSVPPFLAHEGAIIALVGAEEPTLVPPLLTSDPAGTVLLGDVPGADDWDAPEDRLRTMVRTLLRVQARWADRIDELLAAGLPDARANALVRLVEALLSRPDVRAQLADDELHRLDALTSELPERLAALDACGLPDTLVHGDFHQGNWRFDGRSLVLLDWGDSVVGSPMLDLSAFEERVPKDVRARVRATWVDAWRSERPGSDPAGAAELIEPIAELRRAVIYQGFLDRIEPSERRYHHTDVPDWLRAALASATDG